MELMERRRTGWDRPVNHLAHIVCVLWINGLYNLSVNIILTNPVYGMKIVPVHYMES